MPTIPTKQLLKLDYLLFCLTKLGIKRFFPVLSINSKLIYGPISTDLEKTFNPNWISPPRLSIDTLLKCSSPSQESDKQTIIEFINEHPEVVFSNIFNADNRFLNLLDSELEENPLNPQEPYILNALIDGLCDKLSVYYIEDDSVKVIGLATEPIQN